MPVSYSAIAIKPGEILSCTALNARDFPERYAEKVEEMTKTIEDDSLKTKVEQTLGCFETGTAGNLIQSSPYRLLVLQELLPQGKRLVTMERLRIARKNCHEFMGGFYVDADLNLVPYKDANEVINPFQAGELEKDLKDIGTDTTNAILVPYYVLTMQVDGGSPSGLVFKLSEEGRDTAKQVVRNTSDFTWNYKPMCGGLFGACLGGVSVSFWGCGGGDLEYSGRVGGVVFESAEGTSQKNLEEFIARRDSAREEYNAKLVSMRDELDREIRRRQ